MSEAKDLKYWKDNCEENYITTPISVLRYITELEKEVNKSDFIALVIPTLSTCKEAKDNFKQKKGMEGFDTTIKGAGNHFQSGANWAINWMIQKYKDLNPN